MVRYRRHFFCWNLPLMVMTLFGPTVMMFPMASATVNYARRIVLKACMTLKYEEITIFCPSEGIIETFVQYIRLPYHRSQDSSCVRFMLKLCVIRSRGFMRGSEEGRGGGLLKRGSVKRIMKGSRSGLPHTSRYKYLCTLGNP